MNSSICKPNSCSNTYCCSQNNGCANSKDDCYYINCGDNICSKIEGCVASQFCLRWLYLKIIIIVSIFFCFFVTLTICYKKYKRKKFQMLLLPEFNFDLFFSKKIKNGEKTKENTIEEKPKENSDKTLNQLNDGLGYIITEQRRILSEDYGYLSEIDYHKGESEVDKRVLSQNQSEIEESNLSDKIPNDSEHFDKRAENYRKNLHVDLHQLDYNNKKESFQPNTDDDPNNVFNRKELDLNPFRKNLFIGNLVRDHEEKKSDWEESKENNMTFERPISCNFSIQKGNTKFLDKLRQNNSSKPGILDCEKKEKTNENGRRNISMFTGDFYKNKY